MHLEPMLTLFIHRSTCHILGSAIELLYNDNAEGPQLTDIYKLTIKRLQISGRLEEWRQTLSSMGGLVSTSELIPDASVIPDTALRLRILLTIQYYRIYMLINYPVLAAVLEQLLKAQNSEDERAVAFLRETTIPVVKSDWLAAKELCRIIHAVSTATSSPFLDPSTDWWTCNYTSESFSPSWGLPIRSEK
jgi:hypothetical protein